MKMLRRSESWLKKTTREHTSFIQIKEVTDMRSYNKVPLLLFILGPAMFLAVVLTPPKEEVNAQCSGGGGPGNPPSCTTPSFEGNCPAGTFPILGMGGLCCNPSPILIDVRADGVQLTDAANGVLFDLNSDGQLDQVSWTASGSNDAWVALDRNGNGMIDNGGELFGNFTEQPPSSDPNGFRALAVFDGQANGGNGNHYIDQGDAIFPSLRLWRDGNHNGIVTTQPRRGTRDTKGKRMEMSLMKPAKLTLVRPLSALVVRLVPFCGYA
jgi:hypothetical protein